jgi:hypothetical protein
MSYVRPPFSVQCWSPMFTVPWYSRYSSSGPSTGTSSQKTTVQEWSSAIHVVVAVSPLLTPVRHTSYSMSYVRPPFSVQCWSPMFTVPWYSSKDSKYGYKKRQYGSVKCNSRRRCCFPLLPPVRHTSHSICSCPIFVSYVRPPFSVLCWSPMFTVS